MTHRNSPLIFILLLTFLAALGLSAGATEYTYTGPNGGNWNSGANWSACHVPNGVDNQARINNDPPATSPCYWTPAQPSVG